MITFPNAKINLGLNIVERRNDGFHNLESIMIPVLLCDSLEIVRDTDNDKVGCDLQVFGLEVDGGVFDNLCCKAYNIMAKRFDLPAVKMILLKNIPIGAGLGGGSSDAAFTVKMLNRLFELDLSDNVMRSICSELGSDCGFFIQNEVALASGRGEVLHPLKLDLRRYHIVIVCPELHINTKGAYALINPDGTRIGHLTESLKHPIEHWKEIIGNDFEENIFKQFPDLNNIKNRLYSQGALYASMTGSGSGFYGIFPDHKELNDLFPDCNVWCFMFD